MLAATAAIRIVIGANIGTTSTALLASISMGRTARRSALANLIFNSIGVAFFLPFLPEFSESIVALSGGPALAVACAHLVLNLVMTVVILLVLRFFGGWIPG